MSGVNAVPQRTGLLDTVLKGVAVARDIYGIKHEMAATDAQEQQSAQNKQTFDDSQAGIVSSKDYLDHASNFKPAGPDDKNAIEIKRRTGPNPEDVVAERMIPMARYGSRPMGVQNALDPVTGETGTQLYGPDGALGAFIKTQGKATKPDPVGHWKPAGFDPSGNPISQNDLSGEYKVGDIGPVNKKGGVQPAPGDPGSVDKKAVSHEADKLYDTFVKGTGRSEVGSLKNKIDTAENLKALVDAHPDGNLPPPLQTELAIGMAKMVGGAVPSEGEISKMDPQTKGTFIANLMQKFTGEPYGANNPGFVKLFSQTIDREKGIAQDQIGRTVQQAISFAPNMFKSDQKRFYGLVGAKPENFQVSPEGDVAYVNKMIGKTGPAEKASGDGSTAIAAPQGSVKPAAAFHDQANTALKWAQDNPKDPRAQEILKRLNASDQPDVPAMGGGRP